MEVKPIERPSRELVEGFRSICTSTIGDLLDKMGLEGVTSGLKPVKESSTLVGPAVTVKETSGSVGTYAVEDFPIGEVTDFAQSGDVLVFDNGSEEISTWGG